MAGLRWSFGAPATFTGSSGRVFVGQVFGGRFRVEALLGTGAAGEVFRAFDLALKIWQAVRTVDPKREGEHP